MCRECEIECKKKLRAQKISIYLGFFVGMFLWEKVFKPKLDDWVGKGADDVEDIDVNEIEIDDENVTDNIDTELAKTKETPKDDTPIEEEKPIEEKPKKRGRKKKVETDET